MASAVDVIVTGDEAFLSLALDRPRILMARHSLDSFADTGAPPTDILDDNGTIDMLVRPDLAADPSSEVGAYLADHPLAEPAP